MPVKISGIIWKSNTDAKHIEMEADLADVGDIIYSMVEVEGYTILTLKIEKL